MFCYNSLKHKLIQEVICTSNIHWGGGYLLGTKSFGRPLALASSASLALLLSLMLFPALPDSASAEETSSKVNLTISPVISLSLQDTVDLNVTPTQNGTFSSNTASLSISTNNETGYSLYMATSNGKNTLTSNNPSTTNVISAINTTPNDTGITSSNFTSNTWGYNLSQDSPSSTTTYKPVPTTNGNTAIISTTSPTDTDTYNLTFGTKVDTTLPSGTYSNQVIISAVANPAYVPSLSQIDNIQEMTPEICQASTNGETATLTDTRDNNTYTVAKLPDGACWMTQNLRLSSTTEDGSSRILTSADSNVTQNWTFPTGSLTSGDSYTEARSTISTDPEHALEYGGYYNYCAASAGSVCDDITEQNATQDICPKGWRLPTYNEQSGIRSYVSAFSPIYSGFYYNGSLHNTGSYGSWWSATAGNYDSGSQYYLYYNAGSMNASLNAKYRGFSVRCIRAS